MAAFHTQEFFYVPLDYQGKHLLPGAVYLPDHDVTGLSAAEAGELLLQATEGTFYPLDAEAETISEWAARKRLEMGEVNS